MRHGFAIVQEHNGGVPGDSTTSVRGDMYEAAALAARSDPTPRPAQAFSCLPLVNARSFGVAGDSIQELDFMKGRQKEMNYELQV